MRVHSHLYLCDACGRLLFNHNKKSKASITILNHQKGPLGGALLAGTIVCNPLLSSYIKTYLILKQGLPVLILFPREGHRCVITNEPTDRCSSPGNRMRFAIKAHPVPQRGTSIGVFIRNQRSMPLSGDWMRTGNPCFNKSSSSHPERDIDWRVHS